MWTRRYTCLESGSICFQYGIGPQRYCVAERHSNITNALDPFLCSSVLNVLDRLLRKLVTIQSKQYVFNDPILCVHMYYVLQITRYSMKQLHWWYGVCIGALIQPYTLAAARTNLRAQIITPTVVPPPSNKSSIHIIPLRRRDVSSQLVSDSPNDLVSYQATH